MGTRLFWSLWAAFVALWLAALCIASPFDLEISVALADPQALWGRLVQRFGEWPGWIAVVVSLAALVAGRKPDSGLRAFRPLALAVIVLAVVQPLIITQSLKLLWGRVRFRDLGMDFTDFTPFFMPSSPGTTHLSFPSGHVAMACVVTPLVFFLGRTKGRLAMLAALVCVLAYTLSVAFGRILAGAHYLTDCLFSLGLSFLLAPHLVRRLTRPKNEPPDVAR